MTGLTKTLLIVLAIFTVIGAVWRAVTEARRPDPTPTPTSAGEATAIASAGPGTPTAVPAPLGDVVAISILTTDTKAEWLKEVTDAFNAARYRTSAGHVVQAEMLRESGPQDSVDGVLSGRLQPVLWSPGDISWIEQANQRRRDLNQRPLVQGECPPVVYVATGFAMWRPMAQALGWPDTPIGWSTIVELASNPEGWEAYGHPEWGEFTFGHSHPERSSTGFNMLASLAYASAGKTSDLTPQDVKSDAVVAAFRQVELHTYHYGTSTSGILKMMSNRGPSYLHAVTASEPAMLITQERVPPPLQWAFIFPAEGTFWMDNPTCILQASWVTEEQAEAATIYRDYLLAPEAQDLVITHGMRPANPDIAMHDPISLENGTDPRVSWRTVPPLENVSGETNAAIIDVFKETKKKVTVTMLLDTSFSMLGDKIQGAVDGAAAFLERLHQDDEVDVVMFGDDVIHLQPAGRVGSVGEQLEGILAGLYVEGNTALYDAVCTAVEDMSRRVAEDEAAGEQRLYGIVLLSDGKDTNSHRTEADMFACIPTGEDIEGVKIFTIAYGNDADSDLLTRIANRTNGRMFEANPENIREIYDAVAHEQ